MTKLLAIALAIVFGVTIPSQLTTLDDRAGGFNATAQLDTSQVEVGEPITTDAPATDEPGDTQPDDGEDGCAVVYADDLPDLAVTDLIALGWQGEMADGEEALYSPGCY